MADREMLLVGSKVKQFIKNQGLMTSGELLEALNGCIYCCLERACSRAKANGRKTVKGQDV